MDEIRVGELELGEEFETILTHVHGKVVQLKALNKSIICKLYYADRIVTKDLHSEIRVAVPYYLKNRCIDPSHLLGSSSDKASTSVPVESKPAYKGGD